jgi:hypothetical protein
VVAVEFFQVGAAKQPPIGGIAEAGNHAFIRVILERPRSPINNLAGVFDAEEREEIVL